MDITRQYRKQPSAALLLQHCTDLTVTLREISCDSAEITFSQNKIFCVYYLANLFSSTFVRKEISVVV